MDHIILIRNGVVEYDSASGDVTSAPPVYVPPSDTPPAYVPPAAGEPDPHNLDFVRDAQANIPVYDYAALTVPEGWTGRLLVETNVRPGTQPYSTTLNGGHLHNLFIPNNNNPYWLAYGVDPHPGDIAMTDRTVRLDVQQPSGSSVVLQFQPDRA